MKHRIRRAWHHALQHLHLWQPATPHVRVWDKDMNYIATLQRGQRARYTPTPIHKTCDTQRKLAGLGDVHVNLTIDFDFDEAGHELAAAREHITTIATRPRCETGPCDAIDCRQCIKPTDTTDVC